MPGNYSAVGGYGMNPYDPRPRSAAGTSTTAGRCCQTGGSSSGIGTAASFWAANVGTETSGSVLSPSNQNMLVGHQADRRAHQPLRRHPDHGGPGHTGPDGAHGGPTRRSCSARSRAPRPIRTTRRRGPARRRPGATTAPFLKPDGLKGARIGIPRAFFYDPVTLPGDDAAARRAEPRAGAAVMAEAIEVLKQQGAVIVDPADIPSVVTTDAARNFLLWNTCGGWDEPRRGTDADCSIDFEVRHEARLQRVAGVARAGGAASSRSPNCAGGTSRTRGPARSSTASRCSTSPTRWTSRRTARSTRPTARRTSIWRGTHGITR